ncbi:MAG: hypothetical protein LUE17_02640 [Planctomycetaceae bacterium]|nr:hypothetical protein [Planctomycetaceae bacterium]
MLRGGNVFRDRPVRARSRIIGTRAVSGRTDALFTCIADGRDPTDRRARRRRCGRSFSG